MRRAPERQSWGAVSVHFWGLNDAKGADREFAERTLVTMAKMSTGIIRLLSTALYEPFATLTSKRYESGSTGMTSCLNSINRTFIKTRHV